MLVEPLRVELRDREFVGRAMATSSMLSEEALEQASANTKRVKAECDDCDAAISETLFAELKAWRAHDAATVERERAEKAGVAAGAAYVAAVLAEEALRGKRRRMSVGFSPSPFIRVVLRDREFVGKAMATSSMSSEEALEQASANTKRAKAECDDCDAAISETLFAELKAWRARDAATVEMEHAEEAGVAAGAAYVAAVLAEGTLRRKRRRMSVGFSPSPPP